MVRMESSTLALSCSRFDFFYYFILLEIIGYTINVIKLTRDSTGTKGVLSGGGVLTVSDGNSKKKENKIQKYRFDHLKG